MELSLWEANCTWLIIEKTGLCRTRVRTSYLAELEYQPASDTWTGKAELIE